MDAGKSPSKDLLFVLRSTWRMLRIHLKSTSHPSSRTLHWECHLGCGGSSLEPQPSLLSRPPPSISVHHDFLFLFCSIHQNQIDLECWGVNIRIIRTIWPKSRVLPEIIISPTQPFSRETLAPFLAALASLVCIFIYIYIYSQVKNGRVVVGQGSFVLLKSVFLLYFQSGFVFHFRSNTLGCAAP